MNIKIDNLTFEEALKSIDVLLKKKNHSYVVTPNVDHIIKLQEDKELQKAYNNADLILADGQPLIWISKYYNTPLKEKISGSDLFPELCRLAAKKGYTMYFLGAAENVAKTAAEKLKKKYNGLKIVGTHSPSYGFENDKNEINRIIEMVNYVKPDILIVGLGAPKQEKFIYKYISKLNVGIALGLGASLDFEAGNIKRAPKWMSNIGLEWFYRFIKEPKRLFRRYFIDDVKIIPLIIKYINEK